LPEHHRIVFNWYVMEEYSHKQIGAMLGISPGTSKSHLARARKKIQELLLEKAHDMKEKRKRAVIILFPVVKKEAHFLDKMYREALPENTLEPAGEIPEILAKTMKEAPPLQVAGTKVLLKSMAWGGATLTVAALVSVLYWPPKPTGPIPASETAVKTAAPFKETDAPAPKIDSAVSANPALSFETVPDATQNPPQKHISASGNPKVGQREPVIVKKQITVKDTLVQIIK
jgi:Sigma-70, region 4